MYLSFARSSTSVSTPMSDSNLDNGNFERSENIIPHALAPDNAVIAYGTPESSTEEDNTCYVENVSAYDFIRGASS